MGLVRARKSVCYRERMNDRYRLGGLDDVQLLAGLSALVRRENDCLSDLLAHLAELDERALCIALRVMKRGLEALRSELLKKRFGVGRKPRCLRSRTSEPQAASEAPAPRAASRF